MRNYLLNIVKNYEILWKINNGCCFVEGKVFKFLNDCRWIGIFYILDFGSMFGFEILEVRVVFLFEFYFYYYIFYFCCLSYYYGNC